MQVESASVSSSAGAAREYGVAVPKSSKLVWAGRIISALVVLMLLFSATMKLVKTPVVDEFKRLGWPESSTLTLGILEVCVALVYAVPRTAPLGAILVTGYLGGAVATHLRIGDPFIGPVIFGVFTWLGLYFRDHRLRALLPFSTKTS